MKSFRSLLFLLSLVVGLASRASALNASFRLFEIAVTRFSPLADGRARLEYGHLGANAQVSIYASHDVAMPPGMPETAMGKLLVSSEAWFAFQSLGPQAVANFERVNRGVPHVIAGIPHYEVEAHASPQLDVARVINLSTRGQIAPGQVPTLVGGFVIEGEPNTTRRVLIRAIGPSLAQFGVSQPAADPFLFIQKGGTTYHFNGNWGERFDADAIEQTSAQVGAFPIARNSKDAALLVELPRGAYTASIVTEGNTAGGTALLEIYVLP